jgi:hypothetical protein
MRKKVSRSQFMKFPSEKAVWPRCNEACATDHEWGREALIAGQKVRLVAPIYVKPVFRGKRIMLPTQTQLLKWHFGQPPGLWK